MNQKNYINLPEVAELSRLLQVELDIVPNGKGYVLAKFNEDGTKSPIMLFLEPMDMKLIIGGMLVGAKLAKELIEERLEFGQTLQTGKEHLSKYLTCITEGRMDVMTFANPERVPRALDMVKDRAIGLRAQGKTAYPVLVVQIPEK